MNEQIQIQWNKLSKSDIPLTSFVNIDDTLETVLKPFDYTTNGTSSFYPYEIPEGLPKEYNIGVIVGASGTGKSTLLANFGLPKIIKWNDDKSIVSHFANPNEAIELLSAAGLMSVPDWVKPYFALSNGQKFRANLARSIEDNAVIDEFTSVVDRNVARAASNAMSRYIRKNNIKNVTIATCHRDVLEFLEPDWVIDTDRGEWFVGRYLKRPELHLTIYPCKNTVWSYFAEHHYLSETINKAAHCYLAIWEGRLVGFESVIAYPSGTVKHAFREHRLVIHPDYQGFGFGHTLSEVVAQHYVDNGKRFFSKTAHPRLGEYRDNSKIWKATSKNHLIRKDAQNHRFTKWKINTNRWSYSHEYVGAINE